MSEKWPMYFVLVEGKNIICSDLVSYTLATEKAKELSISNQDCRVFVCRAHGYYLSSEPPQWTPV